METQSVPILFTALHTQISRIEIYQQMKKTIHQNHKGLILRNLIILFLFVRTLLFFFTIVTFFKLFKKFIYHFPLKSV